MIKPLVISIASVSGGGKTTVVNALCSELASSKSLHFDDYDFEEYPENFYQWVTNGADYNAWNTEILANDIKHLLDQKDIKYIFLDYPFAYKNDKIATYIDCSIFIDTPLDIAMARRIIRDMKDEPMDLLKKDLNYYMNRGRIAYLEMLKTIKPNSDLIIDGSLSLEDIVFKIIKTIEELRKSV